MNSNRIKNIDKEIEDREKENSDEDVEIRIIRR